MTTPARTIYLLFVFQQQGWRKRREPKAGAMRKGEVAHTQPFKVRPRKAGVTVTYLLKIPYFLFN